MMNNHSENSNQRNKSKRRDFLNILLGGGFIAWLGALFFPVFKYLDPPKVEEVKVSNVKIGAVEDMEKDSGKIIKFGNKPVIVNQETYRRIYCIWWCLHTFRLYCSIQKRLWTNLLCLPQWKI